MSRMPSEAMQGLLLRGARPRLADYRLAVFDMDSTLIAIECIDEIAAMAGKGAEVAAITEAAMRGEIPDFRASLASRLALLAGQPASLLDRVLHERLRFSEGAQALCAALKAAGLKLALVSGGFTHFSQPVAQALGMDRMRANALALEGDCLSGHVLQQAWGDVVDAQAKRLYLLELCEEFGITPAQAIAVGDGSNDLLMMAAAGLSVAFHAKPRVREQARICIDEGGLDRLLELMD